MKSKLIIEDNFIKKKQKTGQFKTNIILSNSSVNKTRSNLLKIVDNELNILKNNCPTKVNNKSLKEAEKEFNTFNSIVQLKTETYSTNCILSYQNINLSYHRYNSYKKSEKENSKKISVSDHSLKKTNFSFREMLYNNINESEEGVKKKIISFREVNYFKEKFLKETKQYSLVNYNVINFTAERNLMMYVGTPNFSYKLETNFENDDKNHYRRDVKDLHKCKMKKGLMYLQKLALLLKNPIDNRKINSYNFQIEKRKLSSEFRKKNRKIKIAKRFNKNFKDTNFIINSESKNKADCLQNVDLRLKRKNFSINKIFPPINKICIEESKKYFFGNC